MNQDNSLMILEQELAKRLFNEGAVLIIAGVPKGTEFGIDLCSYTIGDNFRGVKMIPPGLHYVWCAPVGPYGDIGSRSGFAYMFHLQEIVIKEWDFDKEELRQRQTENIDLEKQRIRQNLQEFDRFLAPYDLRYRKYWLKFTSGISNSTFERCKPELDMIRISAELQSCPDLERPRNSLCKSHALTKQKILFDENELLPCLKVLEGTSPRFSKLPERVPSNSSPGEISMHSIDCIEACNTLLNSYSNTLELIEEIKLAFVFFLVGFSVESLSFWRKILNLFAHSEEAVVKYRQFYLEYCEILAEQIPHLPEELLESSEHNTVYKDVRLLLINLNLGGLKKSADKLSKILLKSMNWEFPNLYDEDPEYMPVIVEM